MELAHGTLAGGVELEKVQTIALIFQGVLDPVLTRGHRSRVPRPDLAMAGIEKQHAEQVRQIAGELEDSRRRLILAVEYYDKEQRRLQVAKTAGLFRDPEEAK